jgi:hypothetical protein
MQGLASAAAASLRALDFERLEFVSAACRLGREVGRGAWWAVVARW